MAAPRAPPRRFSSPAADFFPARAFAAGVPRGRRAGPGARAPPRGGRRGRFRPARPRIRRVRRWGYQTGCGPGSRAKAKRGRNALPIAIRVNFTELHMESKDPSIMYKIMHNARVGGMNSGAPRRKTRQARAGNWKKTPEKKRRRRARRGARGRPRAAPRPEPAHRAERIQFDHMNKPA